MFIVNALLGGLLALVSTIAGKVIFSLGMGYLIYSGIDTTMSTFVGEIVNEYAKLPPEIRSVVAYMQVGSCINIILSGLSIRLMFMGLHSDTVSKLISMTGES